MLRIELPPDLAHGDLSFTYEAALILVLLAEYKSLRKSKLDEILSGLGLDPKAKAFKVALKKMIRTNAVQPKSYPNYKPTYMGQVFARTIELYLNTKQSTDHRIPSRELLAAFLRLPVSVGLLDELGLVGGWTLDEAKNLHSSFTKTRILDLSLDEWIETACTAGIGFWFDGRYYLLTMLESTQEMILKGCASIQVYDDKESA